VSAKDDLRASLDFIDVIFRDSSGKLRMFYNSFGKVSVISDEFTI